MGRAALQCGHIPYSVAELLAARDLDAQSAKQDTDDEDAGETKETLKSDNEWLSAAYSAANQPEEATSACLLAHPELKTCGCFVVQQKLRCATTRSILPSQ